MAILVAKKRDGEAQGRGSIVAATLGGFAVACAPVAFLKVLLGCALLAAAAKTVTHK